MKRQWKKGKESDYGCGQRSGHNTENQAEWTQTHLTDGTREDPEALETGLAVRDPQAWSLAIDPYRAMWYFTSHHSHRCVLVEICTGNRRAGREM